MNKDLQDLKMWIDIEFTVLHIMFAIVLGVLIGGKFWFLAGVYIFICFIYMTQRALKLPKNYLSVKGIPNAPKSNKRQ